MNRKTLQVIGMEKGLRIKLSFFEDEDDQPRGSYSIVKTNNIENGNLTFEIPIDVTKVTIAMHYKGIDYALIGHKLEKTVVTRIFFDEWIRNHKAKVRFLETQGFPMPCMNCGAKIESVHEYEIHQCLPREED